MVFDGLVDATLQRIHIRELAIASGAVTWDMIPQLDALERRCLSSVYTDPRRAYAKCTSIMGYLSMVDGGIDNSDLRYYSTNGSAYSDLVEEYLQ